jgi:hypothetical protein
MAGHTGAFLVCLTAVLGLCDALRVRTEAAAGVGTFWWFTDMHVDVWGSLDEKPVCAWTPSEQMVSGLNAMKELNGDPDFIVMSGDIVHFPPRNNSDLTPELVLFTIEQVTQWVQKTFPRSKMYGTVGNHDLSPSNNWPSDPAETKWLYSELARIWSPWLPPDALATLGATGWYSADVEGVDGLRVIAPNTNYWAYYNTYISLNSTIANVQWEWFESELAQARAAGRKVYINGHHPPVGQFQGNEADDLWPLYTQRYVMLMESYADIVVAGFFGHEHVDEFRLLRECNYFDKPSQTSHVNSCNGKPYGVVYVGQCMSNCGSPAFREWTFDRGTKALVDYKSYIYDSAVAAASEETNRTYAAEWPLQYQWSTTFPNMQNMSAGEWEKQIHNMGSNETAFAAFMKLRQPSNPACTGADAAQCKSWMLCNFAYGTYAEFLQCAYRGFAAYTARLMEQQTTSFV